MVDSVNVAALIQQASAPTSGADIAYWVITGLMVPVIGFLTLWVKQLIKEKADAVEAAHKERVEDLREQIQQYHDAIRVVEASFELAKTQTAAGDAFRERVQEFITSSKAFQERVLELLRP